MGSHIASQRHRGVENAERKHGNDERLHRKRNLLPQSDEFFFVPPENLMEDLRDEFDIVKKLGSGTTSSVWLMTQKVTGRRCAVKKMKRYHKKITQSFRHEAQVLQKINHNHVIKLVGVYVDCTYCYIAQEVCTGETLWDRVNRGPLSEEEAIHISYQILDAVKFLHDHNIVHRDIKPNNILYKNSQSNQIVFVDFGLSREIHDTDVFKDWAGTPMYMAPEVTRMRTGEELKKVDMWAVGVTVYILVTNHLPFYGNDQAELLVDICQRPLRFPDQGETDMARRFIASLLRRRVDTRLSATEAMQHEWLEPAVCVCAQRRLSHCMENLLWDDEDSSEFDQVVEIECMDEATISLIDANDGEYVELLQDTTMIADQANVRGKVLLEVVGDEERLGKELSKNNTEKKLL